MNLLEKKINTFNVISIDGRIDTTNYNEFEKKISGIIERGETNLVLNCAGLDYISSSGLRVFLAAQKKIHTLKGKLNLCEMKPHIKEIFDISGFSNIFKIFGTEEKAVND
jgi:anti-anti-sigma factor